MRVDFRNMSIGTKIPALVIVSCFCLAVVMGTANYFQASDAQFDAAHGALEAIATGRKNALKDYLESIEQDIRTVAANPVALHRKEPASDGRKAQTR